jgi:seryl-tRNA synthetase
MPTNDEIIRNHVKLNEVSPRDVEVIDLMLNEARSDQKEIDGVNMVGKYWSNKAKERIEKDERQRCIEELRDMKKTIKEYWVINKAIAKLAEKVD